MLAPMRIPSSLAAFAVAAALLVAACGGSSATGTTAGSAVAATTDPGGGSVPAATSQAAVPGTASASPAADAPGTPTTDVSPDGSTPSPALSCSGTAANRDFFSAAAHAVGWEVYCAVLPDGWFVQAGSYRLGDGGVLRVAYSGPGGARLELREGGTCVHDPGCVPSGSANGTAAFGDRQGSFLALDGGGFAVSVDGGQAVSWLVIGANMDEATFRGIAAQLVPVPGNHTFG